MNRKEKLPSDFESRYKNDYLKDQIADDGLWAFIPAVDYSMNSPKGIKRLEKHHVLFEFIDNYLGDMPFAFEPNMQDNRYVLLPDDVGHQGMGVTVSSEVPGFLEVGHFWYPSEFTEKTLPIGPDQVYVANFCMKPGPELANMVKDIYTRKNEADDGNFCTFPFSPDHVVTLSGYFMDHTNKSAEIIRNVLKDAEYSIKRNGEGLIEFMQRMMQ